MKRWEVKVCPKSFQKASVNSEFRRDIELHVTRLKLLSLQEIRRTPFWGAEYLTSVHCKTFTPSCK